MRSGTSWGTFICFLLCAINFFVIGLFIQFGMPSNKDLQKVERELIQHDKELAEIVEDQNEVIVRLTKVAKEQARELRELRLKQLEFKYHRHTIKEGK